MILGAPPATELAAAELGRGVIYEAASEEAAIDEGARLLASGTEEAGLEAGVDPPPPPPPPQAVSETNKERVMKSLDGFINRSY